MDHRKLRRDEPLAIEFAAALKQRESERLQRLLVDEPSLACCVVVDKKGSGRTPPHLFADWPGHCPDAVRSSPRPAAPLSERVELRWYNRLSFGSRPKRPNRRE
jgi:hypothetical protein